MNYLKFLVHLSVSYPTEEDRLPQNRSRIAPKRIISDRGRSFTSKSFKDFCRELKITHHLNAVGTPCGNDQICQNLDKVVLHNQQEQEKQKLLFDKKRCRARKLEIGDLVLVQIFSIVSDGSSRKLLPKWKGHFQISKILEADRYEVWDIPGSLRARVPYKGVYAIEHIKLWEMMD
ncbi:hypothetical protein QE152_g6474 [Popillia japonica]|uniref:Integrase catalytic domain-containing protein n=1 Tax=Popillia japonica TaxID=7064 RepID=A0AAW1MEA7_POPJA